MRTKVLVLGLLIVTLLSSSSIAGEAHRTRPWHADMTAVVLRDARPSTRAEIVAEIATLGGTVVLESDGVLICWMSGDAVEALAGHPNIAAASKTPLRIEDLQLASPDAANAIGYFNWVASGDADEDLDRPRQDFEFQDRVIQTPGTSTRPGPIQAHGMELQTLGTHDRFSGTILVNLFLVQSVSLPTSATHAWSSGERSDAFNRVADVMAWWRSRYESQFADSLAFSIRRRDVVEDLVEMANSDSTAHRDAIALIMRNACSEFSLSSNQCPFYTLDPNRAHDAVDKFNIHTQGGATSAFSIFIPYNPSGSPGVFGGNEAGYTAGPDWVAPYRPVGTETNLSPVGAHETGHIFGACDEYKGCDDCGTGCGRSGAPNGNCFEATKNLNSCYLPGHDRRRCIMTNDFGAYDAPTDELTKACAFTRMQIGWWATPSCFQDVPWDLGDNTSWQGEYFDHLSPALDEVAQQIRNDGTGFLDKSFGVAAPPGCMTNADGFAVRWKRKVKFDPAGVYTFTVTADEGFALYLDGAEVAKQTTPATDAKFDFGVNAGPHEVRLEYFDTTGDARAKLSWAPKTGTSCPALPIQAFLSSNRNACPNGTGSLTLSVRNGVRPWKVSLRVTETGQLLGFVVDKDDNTINVPVGPAGTYNYSIVNVTDKNGCPGTGVGTGTIVVSNAPRFPGFATATVDRDACTLVIQWPAAETCKTGESVVYSLLRDGQPISDATCLPSTVTQYVDRNVVQGATPVYRIIAEGEAS